MFRSILPNVDLKAIEIFPKYGKTTASNIVNSPVPLFDFYYFLLTIKLCYVYIYQ